MSQRLMVLGAGLGQLPVIRRAVELGCTVITVDYLPDNPWIHQPFEIYDRMRPQELKARLAG